MEITLSIKLTLANFSTIMQFQSCFLRFSFYICSFSNFVSAILWAFPVQLAYDTAKFTFAISIKDKYSVDLYHWQISYKPATLNAL